MNKNHRLLKKLHSVYQYNLNKQDRLTRDSRLNTKFGYSPRTMRIDAILSRIRNRVRHLTPPEPGDVRMSRCDYSGGAPRGYKCGECGMKGVKLWREYQTFMDHQSLYCASCSVEKNGKGGEVDDNGKWSSPSDRLGIQTDTVGWRVPAVPTEDGRTFWGYTSVPEPGVSWWKRLPTRLAAEMKP